MVIDYKEYCMSNLNQASSIKRESMLHLIKKQRWRRVKQLLESNQAQHYCQEQDASKLSVLAKALGYAAPLEIVDAIVKTNPALVHKCDDYGANALHVGCLNGAPFESIRHLACNSQQLTITTDNDHRTPLHHAVEHACEDGENFHYYTDVVELLCTMAPQTILLGDKGGETPTDIVQLVKLDHDLDSPEYLRMDNIYRLMKSHYIHYYMKQKKTWELNGHMRTMVITANTQPTLQSSSSLASPQTKLNDEITSTSTSVTNSLTSITRSRQSHIPLINNNKNSQDKIDEIAEENDKKDHGSIPASCSSSKRKLRPSTPNEILQKSPRD